MFSDAGFPYDYRVTLLEKMRARRLHYGSAIVCQGDLVKSITIICRGEALLKTNPKKLSQQYELGGNQRPLTIIQKRREIIKQGYAAAEEILKQKSVTVATLGVCEIIGDVEFVLGRLNHHITALANTEVLVMDMELGELQRLIAKRDGGISDFFYNTVLGKLRSRADRCTRGMFCIPVLIPLEMSVSPAGIPKHEKWKHYQKDNELICIQMHGVQSIFQDR